MTVVSRISRREIVAECRKRFGRLVPDHAGVRSVYYDLLSNAGKDPWCHGLSDARVEAVHSDLLEEDG